MSEHQYPLHFPARPTDEVLAEKLAAAVERSNSATIDPIERANAFREVQRLRALLIGGVP